MIPCCAVEFSHHLMLPGNDYTFLQKSLILKHMLGIGNSQTDPEWQ
jgi:hypothetical protein